MVIALAGRRIDTPARAAGFSLRQVDAVQEALRRFFRETRPAALVCSAACGADLVALEAAREVSARGGPMTRRHIVLPFDRNEFRVSSVTDRQGDWGPTYDRLLDDAERVGDLVVLDLLDSGEAAYQAANEAILDEALRLAGPQGATEILALVVWDGPRAAGPDATAGFVEAARRRGIPVRQLSLLAPLDSSGRPAVKELAPPPGPP